MTQPQVPSQTIQNIHTPVSQAFGASIQVQLSGAATFLVVGRESCPAGVVQGAGGQVLMLLGERRLLAVLPLVTGFGLKNHPQIQLCGPVSIDFKRLVAVLGGQQSAGLSPEGEQDGR